MKELPAASIGSELLLRREGRPAVSRLEFDPTSGELRLRSRSEVPAPSNRATVVDQIASDGFA
jgi:hypothetical protein